MDFKIALSGITDAYGRTPGHRERMRTSSKVVCAILRSWSGTFVLFFNSSLNANISPGLAYLCSNNMQSVISLVDTLRIPSMDTRVRPDLHLRAACRAKLYHD